MPPKLGGHAPPVLLAALITTAALAGCGQPPAPEVAQSPPPEVTFSIEGHSARTGPIRYCDIALTECQANDSAVAMLDVPAGGTVQISVPESVAEAPWQVVFRYRRNGEPAGGRSEVFTPGTRRQFAMQIPEVGTLETLEVQQFGAPELGADEPDFRIRAVWVLSVPTSAGPPSGEQH